VFGRESSEVSVVKGALVYIASADHVTNLNYAGKIIPVHAKPDVACERPSHALMEWMLSGSAQVGFCMDCILDICGPQMRTSHLDINTGKQTAHMYGQSSESDTGCELCRTCTQGGYCAADSFCHRSFWAQ